jgi:large subunit ribosomal protein L5
VMYEFFDRLVAAALPRIRDFRGLSPRKFDGRGNYTFGIADQTIFPEIDLDKIKRTQGMDITLVTSAPDDAQAMDLLKLLGFPFAEVKETPKTAAGAAGQAKPETKSNEPTPTP